MNINPKNKIKTFPRDFVWGTAIAAYQVEGNNTNTDWWNWEQNKKTHDTYPREKSGIACDFYRRYEEDFNLCNQLNNNAVRLSLEWARIEPKKGEFDQEAINYYKNILRSAKERNLKTFVTLHHFTNPLWFSEIGGWSNFESTILFSRYAKKCAQEFGDLIDYFLTINEPQVHVMMGYLKGVWPPNKKNPFLSLTTQITQIIAHNKAYREIKSVNPKYQVGIVKHIVWYEPYKNIFYPLSYLISKFMYFLNSHAFLFFVKSNLDLIGVNFYFNTKLSLWKTKNDDDFLSDMNWWIHAPGLEKILLSLKPYKLPIYITENGCADSKDNVRERFIKEMLESTYNAIEKKADVRGYFYWSLMDNFEWHEGFWPRFGLVEIDRDNNLERKPRKSFWYYANICKDNTII